MRLIPIAALLAALAWAAPPGAEPAATETGAGAAPELVVTVARDGTAWAAGRVPPGLPVKTLRKRLGEVDFSAVDRSTAAAPEAETVDETAWERCLDALAIAITRLREGEARVAAGRLVIAGTLHPGFSAETTRGAVRLALGEAWEAEIEIAEAPPPAAITLAKTAYGTEIRGILPDGIDPAEAEALLGLAAETAMTGGGEGDAAAWRQALAGLSALLAVYVEAEARIDEGAVEIAGTLLPGYQTDGLGAWLGGRLDARWEGRLAGDEQPAAEGDTRRATW